MNPTPGDVFASVPLTNVSIAFQQDQTANFIADKVFPVIPVDLPAGTYWKYDQGDWMRSEVKVRAPGTETAGGGWKTSTDTYTVVPYGFHQDVDDQTLAAASAGGSFPLEEDATRYVTEQWLLTRELIFTQKFFATSLWTGGTGATDITGVSGTPSTNQVKQWDAAGSTPSKDIATQRIAIQQRTGKRPNKLILGPLVWQALEQHADILDRIKYTQTGIITEQLLAAYFGVDQVLIPYAVQNTAVEGATDAFSFLWGKAALLVYAAPNPGLKMPSGGYIFAQRSYLGGEAYSGRIKRYRMEPIASTRVEIDAAFDMKLVAPTTGVFYTALVG